MREARGISQSELARLSGVSVRMIQKYEQEDRNINKAQIETIYKLATSLACKMEEIIEMEELT